MCYVLNAVFLDRGTYFQSENTVIYVCEHVCLDCRIQLFASDFGCFDFEVRRLVRIAVSYVRGKRCW